MPNISVFKTHGPDDTPNQLCHTMFNSSLSPGDVPYLGTGSIAILCPVRMMSVSSLLLSV